MSLIVLAVVGFAVTMAIAAMVALVVAYRVLDR